MRSTSLAVLALLLPCVAAAQSHPDWATPVAAKVKVPAYITRAMQDPARAADRKDDVRRQMAAVLAFSGVKPGDKVLELDPGTGYWTRVFSQIVGPQGHVYTVWPNEMAKYSAKSMAMWEGLVKTSHYANVSVLKQPAQTPSAPQPVDIVFTAQNYHDYHNMATVDIHKFDKAVYDVLKPGGMFVIVDHIAPAGSGTSDTDTFHRIDPAAVKREVESAGFVFDGSSDALLNPRDPLDIPVFDEAIRGHTSQFIYRFRKP